RALAAPAVRGQHIKDRLQMPLVMPPTPDGAAEDRLPHFPETGREYWSLGAMELKAGGLPVEAEEFDQPPALALRVADHRLVIDRQHRQGQYPPPMLGQPLDLEVPPRAIGEVISEGISLAKPLEKAGQTIVARLTPA